MKSAEAPEPSEEDEDSSESDSKSETSESSTESEYKIDGEKKPFPTIITKEFNFEMMISYVCENHHPLETTFFSAGLKLARTESLSNSLKAYFNLKEMPIQCPDCDSHVMNGFNSILTLPNILMLDISFFDEKGKLIRKNFQIPEKLDM